eukprot:11198360-Lingulodinium_polyedra.AAC.1
MCLRPRRFRPPGVRVHRASRPSWGRAPPLSGPCPRRWPWQSRRQSQKVRLRHSLPSTSRFPPPWRETRR